MSDGMRQRTVKQRVDNVTVSDFNPQTSKTTLKSHRSAFHECTFVPKRSLKSGIQRVGLAVKAGFIRV